MSLSSLMEESVKHANWKMSDEARLIPPARINSRMKYLFRFEPGTVRQWNIRLDHLPDDFETEKQEAVLTRKFKKNRAKVDGENPKYDLESMREKVGKDFINFTPIPGGPGRQGTCYYATNDSEIANFLRRKIREGKGAYANLREERPTETIEVNGVSIPNTTEGWDAARIAALTRSRSIDEE